MKAYRAGHRKTLVEGIVPTNAQAAASWNYGSAIEKAVAAPVPGAVPVALNEDVDTLPLAVHEALEEACAGWERRR